MYHLCVSLGSTPISPIVLVGNLSFLVGIPFVDNPVLCMFPWMTQIMQLLRSRRTSFCHSQGATSCPHCDPHTSNRSVGRFSGRGNFGMSCHVLQVPGATVLAAPCFTNFLGLCMTQLPGVVEHDSLPPCSPSFGRTSAQGKLVSCLGHILSKNRSDVCRNRIHRPMDDYIAWRYYWYLHVPAIASIDT